LTLQEEIDKVTIRINELLSTKLELGSVSDSRIKTFSFQARRDQNQELLDFEQDFLNTLRLEQVTSQTMITEPNNNLRNALILGGLILLL